MKGSWLRALIVAIAVIVAGLLALSLWTDIPYAVTRYGCPYCGAHADRVRVMGVLLPARVKEGALSRYWLARVEPSHEHTWVLLVTYSPGRIADHPGTFLRRWMLKDVECIAVLQSLPSPGERIALMDSLWKPEFYGDRRAADRAADRICAIRKAYFENPKRKDWPNVLKSLGIP